MNRETENVTISREDLREIISEGVTEAFRSMGIDSMQPIEMQRDMAHLRKWRVSVEKTTSTTFTVALGVIVSGLLGAVWLGISTIIGQSK